MAVNKLHFGLVIWGSIEVILFGGIIFGWASLVFIYKQEHLFENLCEGVNISISETQFLNLSYTDEGKQKSFANNIYNYSTASNSSSIHHCAEQNKMFNLIYVIAVVLNGMATFPNGIIWDKFGTRFLRTIGIGTYIVGIGLLIFTTMDTAYFLFPAMICVSYGGYIILMTNLQLGNLFPNKKSMIISLYCGSYDSSAFMLILIKLAYSYGIITKYSFLILLSMFSTIIVSTYWYLPKGKIPFPLPENYKIDMSCGRKGKKAITIPAENKETKSCSDKHDREMDTCTDANTSKSSEIISSEKPFLDIDKKVQAEKPIDKAELASFSKEALSVLFLLDLLWLSLMRLQSWSFVGRLNPVLENLANHDKKTVSFYTSVYAFMQFFGVILAPISGRLMDRKKNRKVDAEMKRIESIEVCIASFVLDNTIGLLLAITISIPVLEVQYASFVLHVLHRAFLYGPNSAFIAQAFSSHNFGKLFGMAMTVSAFVSLLQYPLFVLVEGPLSGDPLVFNVLILVLMVVAYAHPLYLVIWCRNMRRKYLKKQKVDS